jgi:hypothetical protein
MDNGDITFIILLSLFLIPWIGGEIRFRKSKDAKWIKKGRGNKSVKKYRESVNRRKFSYIEKSKSGVLNEIEERELIELIDQEHKLKEAYKREERRFLCRSVLWFFIILMLGTYIYHGGK